MCKKCPTTLKRVSRRGICSKSETQVHWAENPQLSNIPSCHSEHSFVRLAYCQYYFISLSSDFPAGLISFVSSPLQRCYWRRPTYVTKCSSDFRLELKNCFALTNLYTTTTNNNNNSTFYNAPAALHNSDAKNRVRLRKGHERLCTKFTVMRICVHVRV